jgi:hypothetical protein
MDHSQKYIDLMSEYKQERKKDREGSRVILKQALELLKSGKVSPQAEEAARYL